MYASFLHNNNELNTNIPVHWNMIIAQTFLKVTDSGIEKQFCLKTDLEWDNLTVFL